MSSQPPGPGSASQDPTPSVDYLGAGPEPLRSGSRRWGIAAVATVGVLAVGGAVAYAVSALAGGGPGAAEAVPGDALAYLALDLDPGAGQKVEAYQMLKKFPALEDALGDADDLRQSLIEAIVSEAPCDDLTFEDDFDPWVGDRVAMSVVPGGDQPIPFFVLQVKDQDKALAGIEAVAACGESDAEDAGTAFVGDYLILAETEKQATQIAADAEKGSLAEADGFRRWVDEAGGQGIVTGYVSADAPAQLVDAAESVRSSSDSATGLGDDYAGLFGDELGAVSSSDEDEAALEELGAVMEGFEGAAMVVRLDDGAVEVETAMSTLPQQVDGDGADSGLVDLPASTVVALGMGVGDGAVGALLDQLAESVGEDKFNEMMAEVEDGSGLSLPEDVEALVGNGFSIAVDASMDPESFAQMTPDTLDLPVGLRITGDPAEIVPVVEKLVALAGAEEQVVVEEGDGVVAVGVTEDYVSRLAEDGDLGDQDGFRAALPDLGDNAGGMFVDFDTDDWLDTMMEGEPDAEEFRENLAPLDSLGVTAQVDGGVTRATIRLSTD